MGIKGIYGEIGPGQRVALSKLAIEKFEETGRPLRIAIDISIWQFQIQAAQGGSNPAIRTLYYRLLRLLSVSVQPLFVFDGPHKPPFKRNKRTGHHGASLPDMLAKQLLKFFGFPFHVAPGEAEAECALLQREGIVDAVLSEDVDTLMFGCGLTFRNWSSEGVRGNKSPTHVSIYDALVTKQGKSGLDREGMILIALMSGGDYITAGIPGCGIKVACEAARAGYGKSLCQIQRSDAAGMSNWRLNLAHEIQKNESKHFRTRHNSLRIPENFPDREVLGYYTHPVVSSASNIEKLKKEISWAGEVDISGLRVFVADAFEWKYKKGAAKFIRGLAPALLVHKLLMRRDRRDSGYGDVALTEMNESQFVSEICGERKHFSTDGIPEFRVVYLPAGIVGLDLDIEEDGSDDYSRAGLSTFDNNEDLEAYVSDEEITRSASPTKRVVSAYDPTQLDKLWIPQTILKVGIPLKVEDYEASLRNPKWPVKAKGMARKATKHGMLRGAMDQYVHITKPSSVNAEESTANKPSQPSLPSASPLGVIASAQSVPATTGSASMGSVRLTRSSRSTAYLGTKNNATTSVMAKSNSKRKPTAIVKAKFANPWASTSSDSTSRVGARVAKPVSQQLKLNGGLSPQNTKSNSYELGSSPVESVPSPSLPLISASRKHLHSLQPEDEHEGESTIKTPPCVIVIDENNFDGSSNKKEGCDGPSLRKKRSAEATSKPDSAPSLSHAGRRSKQQPSPGSNSSFSALKATPLSLRPYSSSIDKTTRQEQDREIIDLSTSTLSSPWRINMPPPLPPMQAVLSYIIDSSGRRHNGKEKTSKRTHIMLRESLPGSWKEADEVETTTNGRSRRAWRISQVEVLDLSHG